MITTTSCQLSEYLWPPNLVVPKMRSDRVSQARFAHPLGSPRPRSLSCGTDRVPTRQKLSLREIRLSIRASRVPRAALSIPDSPTPTSRMWEFGSETPALEAKRGSGVQSFIWLLESEAFKLRGAWERGESKPLLGEGV